MNGDSFVAGGPLGGMLVWRFVANDEFLTVMEHAWNLLPSIDKSRPIGDAMTGCLIHPHRDRGSMAAILGLLMARFGGHGMSVSDCAYLLAADDWELMKDAVNAFIVALKMAAIRRGEEEAVERLAQCSDRRERFTKLFT